MSIALVTDLIYTHSMNMNTMVGDLIFQIVCSSQGSRLRVAGSRRSEGNSNQTYVQHENLLDARH